MGYYAKTGARRSGRPVYRKDDRDDPAYLFFSGTTRSWIIGSDYQGDRGVIRSTGIGGDASSPVNVPTWKHYDGSSFTVAYGITVFAKNQAVEVWSRSNGMWIAGSVEKVTPEGVHVRYSVGDMFMDKVVPHNPGMLRLSTQDQACDGYWVS